MKFVSPTLPCEPTAYIELIFKGTNIKSAGRPGLRRGCEPTKIEVGLDETLPLCNTLRPNFHCVAVSARIFRQSYSLQQKNLENFCVCPVREKRGKKKGGTTAQTLLPIRLQGSTFVCDTIHSLRI